MIDHSILRVETEVRVTFPSGIKRDTIVLHRHWSDCERMWVGCGGEICRECREGNRLLVHYRIPVRCEDGTVKILEAGYKLYKYLLNLQFPAHSLQVFDANTVVYIERQGRGFDVDWRAEIVG